jgi:polyisoprenoid-binding protein YceI
MIAKLRYVIAVTAMTLVAASASAQSAPAKITLHFDPAASRIYWSVGSLLHTVHGTFRLKGGMVTLDQETGEAEGEIIVETASGESGNADRDRKMKDEVLECKRYPEAIFHPEKVTGLVRLGQAETITVEGTFTIHGADHPLFLEVKTTLNGSKLNAKTSFVVPYVAWGMKNPSTLLLRVSKEVHVDVDAQAAVQ